MTLTSRAIAAELEEVGEAAGLVQQVRGVVAQQRPRRARGRARGDHQHTAERAEQPRRGRWSHSDAPLYILYG